MGFGDDEISQKIFSMVEVGNKINPINYWKFVPSGVLKINNKDLDIYVGEVYYANRLYQIRNAIKVKDWVFVLENVIHEPNMIYIAGFHDNTHCTFTEVSINKSDTAPIEAIYFKILMKFFYL